MTKAKKLALKKWGINLLKFSAPILAAFFGVLAQGGKFEQAWPVLVVMFWGALADFFKKLG